MTAAGPFEAGDDMDSKRPPPLTQGSRFYQRLQRRYADVFASLPFEVPQRESLTQAYTQLRTQGLEVGAALRVLRQWTMARLLTLDCEHQASLETVTLGVTHLAEVALDAACQQAFKDLDARHGVPLTSAGKRAEFWVIGMGKLGARELNVSSDIDLIYVYDEDGETTGNEQGLGRISVQEYFARVVKAIYTLIGDTTEHGFVFRVDLALRPNGNSGPAWFRWAPWRSICWFKAVNGSALLG
jgi:glutamate-ammonia-ligase adenylyltransferase